MIKRVLLLLSFSLITSCGFRLRGMVDMPPWLNNVAIVVRNTQQNLTPILKDNLQAYGIRVVPNANQASYLLILEKDSMQQQITSVSASTNPRQYLLSYTIQYSLVNVSKGMVIMARKVTANRQLTVNNNRILGSDSEELMLYHEMRNDAARQIINQLSH